MGLQSIQAWLGKDLLPISLTWLLMGCCSSQVVGLRTSVPLWLLAGSHTQFLACGISHRTAWHMAAWFIRNGKLWVVALGWVKSSHTGIILDLLLTSHVALGMLLGISGTQFSHLLEKVKAYDRDPFPRPRRLVLLKSVLFHMGVIRALLLSAGLAPWLPFYLLKEKATPLQSPRHIGWTKSWWKSIQWDLQSALVPFFHLASRAPWNQGIICHPVVTYPTDGLQ